MAGNLNGSVAGSSPGLAGLLLVYHVGAKPLFVVVVAAWSASLLFVRGSVVRSEREYACITVESLDEGAIARVMLNRPEVRNAQSRTLLVELDDALLAAEADDCVRVVILGGHGPIFSGGHDLGSRQRIVERAEGRYSTTRSRSEEANAKRTSRCISRSGTTFFRIPCDGET